MKVVGQRWSDWRTLETTAAVDIDLPGVVYDETPAEQPDLDWRRTMTCCERPEPRILERNGRLFCGNCRRYLDAPPRAEGDDDGREPAAAGDAGRGDGTRDR